MQAPSDYSKADFDMLMTLKPTWYNNMILVETNSRYKYHKYTYCGLEIIETYDHAYFSATRMMDQVMVKDVNSDTTASMRINDMMSLQTWYNLNEQHPDWFMKRDGTGSTKYGFGGFYMRWCLFDSFIEAARPSASMYLRSGLPVCIDKSGYLYWCKPEKNKACLDSDTEKFGRTWSWTQRVKNYGKQTITRCIIQSHDMYTDEALLLRAVSQFLTPDTGKGDEYYIVPTDDSEVIAKIEHVFNLFKQKYSLEQAIIDLNKMNNEELEQELPPGVKVQRETLINIYNAVIDSIKNQLENMQ